MTWTILEPDCGEDFDQISSWDLRQVLGCSIDGKTEKDVVQIKECVWKEVLTTEA